MKTTNLNVLDNLSNEFNNIASIREQLIKPVKLQLHSGVEGFESPQTYGIYKHDGGQPLGVVGSQFEPANLELFLDTIVKSITECGANLDLSKLKYQEYKGGSKVMFSLPCQDIEVKSPMIGDVIKTRLQFTTGFDGLTKFSLSYSAYRLWCKNGAGRWEESQQLSFKNTISAQAKMLLFCDEIFNAVESIKEYGTFLDTLVTKEVTQKDIDDYLTKITGYNVKEYKELTTRKRNILDKINACIAIEIQNTKANQFSVLQGITRYTTHDINEGSLEGVLFNPTSTKLVSNAHKVFSLN